MRLGFIRRMIKPMLKVNWVGAVSIAIMQSRVTVYIHVTAYTFPSIGSAMSLAHIVWMVPLSPLVPIARLKPLLDKTSPRP